MDNFNDVPRYYFEDLFLAFNLPRTYKVVKLERLVLFNPTIWSKFGDVYQYIRLKNIGYLSHRVIYTIKPSDVKIYIDEDMAESKEDIIELNKLLSVNKMFLKRNDVYLYPPVTFSNYILKKFKNIKKDDLKREIINMCKNESMESCLNIDKSNYEKNIWLKHLRYYKKGDYFRGNNDLFTVECFEIYLKLTLEHKGKKRVIILKDENVVGN